MDIVRLALSRQKVRYHGCEYTLPLPDGRGKALHLMVHPVRDHVPVYLASLGPKNLELTGEIADGWLAVFFAAEEAGESFAHLAAGRARAGRTLDGFDVVSITPLVIGPDVRGCADRVRGHAALYIGGMGSREQNFYFNVADRLGHRAAAEVVQDRYLARDYDGAAAAVPHGLLDATSLLGPWERVADRMAMYAEAGVTTLTITPTAATFDERLRLLDQALEALDRSGSAG